MRPIDAARRLLRAVGELVLPSEVRPRKRPPYQPSRQRVVRARETIARILTENILPFWYREAIDLEDGGYRLNHDLRGTWKGPANKRLVTQARVLWFFSRLTRTEYGTGDHLEAAHHGYQFLRDRLWDARFGGFYWEVDSSGGRVTGPYKHLYGQATALYALTEYARASNETAAAALAGELFGLLEQHAYDPPYAGYRELFQRDWSPARVRVAGYPGGIPGRKLANTHLHVMEAMTTYCLLTDDAIVRDRLLELIMILSNAVVRKRIGVSTEAHLRDWTPLRGRRHERVSYGHDVKRVWLLIEACRAARLSDGPFLDLYRAVFGYALKYGFDRKAGGFYASGRFNAPADRRDKIWWVQAEGLLSALYMYRRTREEQYFACFWSTLGWIANHQVDWRHGEWHRQVAGNGRPSGDKADGWKAAYHNGRAMIECLALLPRPADL